MEHEELKELGGALADYIENEEEEIEYAVIGLSTRGNGHISGRVKRESELEEKKQLRTIRHLLNLLMDYVEEGRIAINERLNDILQEELEELKGDSDGD